MISVACPGCARKLSVKEELAGKRVKCSQCGQVLEVVVPQPAAARTEDPTVPPQSPARGVKAGPVPGGLPANGRPDSSLGETRADAGREGNGIGSAFDFLAPPQAPDELGRLGPYRILKILGTGGMGVVFQAEDPGLERQVALKVMLPRLAGEPQAKQRFLREARAAAALENDHVIAIHQIGEDRGVPFVAMPLLKGESLDNRLKHVEKLSVAEVLRIGREVALGLAAAHEHGLIHRDIKPANIWLEAPRDRVKILDFGLARSATDESQLTQSGAIMGTPAYMAPEQARAQGPDHRADLFSLGAVLYRMTTGQLPFNGADTMSMLAAVCFDDPPPPRSLNPALPEPLSDLVLRLLAKKPEDRPASAQDVVSALESLEGRPSARTKATRRRETDQTLAAGPGVGPVPPRRRLAWWLGACMLAAGGILAGVVYVKTDRGTLQIETNAPDVKVVVEQDGKEVTVVDTRTGREVRLKSGAYTLRLGEEQPGVEITPSRITLKRRATVVATISLRGDRVPLDGYRREDIPAELLSRAGAGDPAKAPAEVVAVFHDPEAKGEDGTFAAISPDGRWLALYHVRGRLNMVDLQARTGTILEVGEAERPFRSHLVFSPDSQTLALCTGAVSLWCLQEGKRWQLLPAKLKAAKQADFSPDGKLLATAFDSRDRTIPHLQLYQASTLEEIEPAEKVTWDIFSMTFHPDGKRILVGAMEAITPRKGKPRLALIDAKAGRVDLAFVPPPEARLEFGDRDIRSISMSRDGRLVSSSHRHSSQSLLWDGATGKLSHILQGDRGQWLWWAALSPDGEQLATIAKNGVLTLWNVATQKVARKIVINRNITTDAITGAPAGVFRAFTWSPEGRHVITVNNDQTVYVLRLAAAPGGAKEP
jgi:hypothetical protein